MVYAAPAPQRKSAPATAQPSKASSAEHANPQTAATEQQPAPLESGFKHPWGAVLKNLSLSASDASNPPGTGQMWVQAMPLPVADKTPVRPIVARPAIVQREAVSGSEGSDGLSERKGISLQAQPNRTGLPDTLKTGLEHLSGYSLDQVKVHYNSAQPAQMQAHAYTQGTDIYVSPGQERHLPHEGWHVVQQMQGRVQATRQLKGVGLNDDARLEREADVMGRRAFTMKQNYYFQQGIRTQESWQTWQDVQQDQPKSTRSSLIERQSWPEEKKAIQCRKEIYKNNMDEDDLIHTIANDIDTAVDDAKKIIDNNPQLNGFDDKDKENGYLKIWLKDFNEFLNTGNIPSFLYARYGYVIEDIATRKVKRKNYDSYTVKEQVTRGATRPDFVVERNNDSQEVAWIDITSESSKGHIKYKQSTGWSTRDYVAEILYAMLDPATVANNISGTLTAKQIQNLSDLKAASIEDAKNYETGREMMEINFQNAIFKASEKKRADSKDATDESKTKKLSRKSEARQLSRKDVQKVLNEEAKSHGFNLTRKGLKGLVGLMNLLEVRGERQTGKSWANWSMNGINGIETGEAKRQLIAYGAKIRNS